MASRSDGARVKALFRTISFTLFAVALGYVALEVVPKVATSFRFAQAMQDEVLYGAAGEPVSAIHRRLVGSANRLGLEIPAEAIVVRKSGATLSISAAYLTRIELVPGLEFDWPVEQHYEGIRRAPATTR